jgi:hypothetical protein
MPVINDLDFRAWEERAPGAVRTDPAWRFHAYRVALYALDCVRDDMPAIRRASGAAIADQLLRSIASSFTWYQAATDALDPLTLDSRLNALGELRSLLLGYQRWLTTKDEKSRLT